MEACVVGTGSDYVVVQKAKKTLFDRNTARYYKGIKKLFNPIWFTN